MAAKVYEFRFQKLDVYSKSVTLAKSIYLHSAKWPKEHQFGITDQLRRAALSIPLNIAEGTSKSTKDFQHFLSIARGSCYECIPLIDITLSLQLLDQNTYNTFYNELYSISQMISKLRSSLDTFRSNNEVTK